METHMEVTKGFKERHPNHRYLSKKYLKLIFAFCVHSTQESFLLIDQIAGFFKTPDEIARELSRSTIHEMIHLLGNVREEIKTISLTFVLDSYLNPKYEEDLLVYAPWELTLMRDYFPHLSRQVIDLEGEE